MYRVNSLNTVCGSFRSRALLVRDGTLQSRSVSLHSCSNSSKASSRRRLSITATYPEPETEKERSPIDIPQEWITPQPSRRPDIFPEFERLETPLPKPLPGDPEVPDEEEEEEEEKKKKNPDDPDKEGDEEEQNPDEPAPSQE